MRPASPRSCGAPERSALSARRNSRILSRMCRPSSSNIGSLIGDVAESREMQGLNDAYERMLTSDVKYRFVVDIASLGA